MSFSTISGNGGSFKAAHLTGLTFDHQPSEEVATGEHEGYAYITRVDWPEHLAFWGKDRAPGNPYTVPHDHIDVLDVRVFICVDGWDEAQADWRNDMLAEHKVNWPALYAVSA